MKFVMRGTPILQRSQRFFTACSAGAWLARSWSTVESRESKLPNDLIFQKKTRNSSAITNKGSFPSLSLHFWQVAQISLAQISRLYNFEGNTQTHDLR